LNYLVDVSEAIHVSGTSLNKSLALLRWVWLSSWDALSCRFVEGVSVRISAAFPAAATVDRGSRGFRLYWCVSTRNSLPSGPASSTAPSSKPPGSGAG
jgi:hypothetical protein